MCISSEHLQKAKPLATVKMELGLFMTQIMQHDCWLMVVKSAFLCCCHVCSYVYFVSESNLRVKEARIYGFMVNSVIFV